MLKTKYPSVLTKIFGTPDPDEIFKCNNYDIKATIRNAYAKYKTKHHDYRYGDIVEYKSDNDTKLAIYIDYMTDKNSHRIAINDNIIYANLSDLTSTGKHVSFDKFTGNNPQLTIESIIKPKKLADEAAILEKMLEHPDYL